MVYIFMLEVCHTIGTHHIMATVNPPDASAQPAPGTVPIILPVPIVPARVAVQSSNGSLPEYVKTINEPMFNAMTPVLVDLSVRTNFLSLRSYVDLVGDSKVFRGQMIVGMLPAEVMVFSNLGEEKVFLVVSHRGRVVIHEISGDEVVSADGFANVKVTEYIKTQLGKGYRFPNSDEVAPLIARGRTCNVL
jgi:hypothetical protein